MRRSLPLLVLAGLLTLAACGPGGGASGSSAGASDTESAAEGVLVSGLVTAGPTCPVVTDPLDPACGDRPVEDAVLLVVDARGDEVARVTSAADGSFGLRLPPGRYRLVPQPVAGLMGTAAEQPLEVIAEAQPEPLAVSYDTGLR